MQKHYLILLTKSNIFIYRIQLIGGRSQSDRLNASFELIRVIEKRKLKYLGFADKGFIDLSIWGNNLLAMVFDDNTDSSRLVVPKLAVFKLRIPEFSM